MIEFAIPPPDSSPPRARIGRVALGATLACALLAAGCPRSGPPAEIPAPPPVESPAASGAEAPSAAAESFREEDFLTRVRQLSYEGRRAGEGYFSSDGRRLVFQSERVEGNPFYQIFELDLESGESRLVSTGQGKTTCAFFQPGTGNIIFSSTHADPETPAHQQAELDFRASGRERRYAWDFDPWMDVYLAPEAGGALVRLTDARGYDAEASFSPDGRWIVFSSTREAYGRPLEETGARQLEADPSYFAELYLMRADGSEQRRLTFAEGYDGGPFFTPDGARIVWRRFDPAGFKADVWSIRPDGSDARQITDFGAMSWAPYTHPSGAYVLFTSNKLGFENFELFIVDIEGRKEPVRITYTPGFDGLPVPSPDGRRLVWTTNRHAAGGGAQLFVGEWNHELALRALWQAPPRRTSVADR